MPFATPFATPIRALTKNNINQSMALAKMINSKKNK
jgi:hypothetical protein